jgi:hypothetical protein
VKSEIPTLQQKYDFLISRLKVHYIDIEEQDALVSMPGSIYVQFHHKQDPTDLDTLIGNAALETLNNS